MSRRTIIDKTLGEIRTFLDEISNGTSNYRGLYSLTEQIEHQYHGRFLIELLQNAHDALPSGLVSTQTRRIEVRLVEDEESYGVLYVANDGTPFCDSNFRAISNLGQSNKDPNEAIGNKGIGFRSVLEISREPEVYSRFANDSASFDGFTFRFSSQVIAKYKTAIAQLTEGCWDVCCPLDDSQPLVIWSNRQQKAFQENCRSRKDDWLEGEIAYLSPYALPTPINEPEFNSTIDEMSEFGFATVIRLPLISAEARETVRENVSRITAGALLFLRRLSELRLVDGQARLIHSRSARANCHLHCGEDIEIVTKESGVGEEASPNKHHYWLWRRTIGGAKDKKGTSSIKKAVISLPGKWPDLRWATVELAVQRDQEPSPGDLSIFLPTALPSGSCAEFSAPFYGDMSRTTVDFSQPINCLLLNALADLARDVVRNSLSGQGPLEAAAIIDILSPVEEAGNRWWEAIQRSLTARKQDIRTIPICLSDQGWTSLNVAKLLPDMSGCNIVTEKIFRDSATYPIFLHDLDSRSERIQAIFDQVEISSRADDQDVGATIEAVASRVLDVQDVNDWNLFWKEVMQILDGRVKPLVGRCVLLGTDDDLHANDEDTTVFFRPRVSGSDDEAVSEDAIASVPQSLQDKMGFLSSKIETHFPGTKGGVRNTPVRDYLARGLVERFGVEQILRHVLVPAVPTLPVPHSANAAALCQDILQFGIRLVLNSRSHTREQVLQLLGRLPAPCIAGWFKLSDTSYGPHWADTSGNILAEYLEPRYSASMKRLHSLLLLPPTDSRWGGLANAARDLLDTAGVFDGLRLTAVDETQWPSDFRTTQGTKISLPIQAPPEFPAELWPEYRTHISKEIKPNYSNAMNYRVTTHYALPGIEIFESLDARARERLTAIVLYSIRNWHERWNWRKVVLRKVGGETHRFNVTSPLYFTLQALPWLAGEIEGAVKSFRLHDRWYIPSQAIGIGIHQYRHLSPIPKKLAQRIESSTGTLDILVSAGMPSYEIGPEKTTDNPRLLIDLATALDDHKSEIANRDVFIGQVRTAWMRFFPVDNTPFPAQIVVREGLGELKAMPATDQSPIYLPDSAPDALNALELHAKPIVVIDRSDAERLRDQFLVVYGQGVRLASQLDIRPIVDGSKFDGAPQATALSDQFPWLGPLLLTIFAFAGNRKDGTETRAFRRALAKIQKARFCFVGKIEASLWSGVYQVARTPVRALWVSDFKVLIASKDVRRDAGLMSDALSSMIGRNDAGFINALKLALKNHPLGPDENPASAISEALQDLGLSSDRYSVVQQRWSGDLAWKIRMLRPVVLLLEGDSDLAPLENSSTLDALADALSSYSFDSIGTIEATKLVRQASSFRDLGRQLFGRLDARAQLAEWNMALQNAGEDTLINENAEVEFRSHLDASLPLLRIVIAALVRESEEKLNYKALDKELVELRPPTEYSTTLWEVEFEHSMQVISQLIAVHAPPATIAEAIATAPTVDELRVKLTAAGINLALDPIQTHSENYDNLKKILKELHRIALAWACSRKTDVPGSHTDVQALLESIQRNNENRMFTTILSDNDCLDMIRTCYGEISDSEFGIALGSSDCIATLMETLGVSSDDLVAADQKIAQQNAQRDRKRRTILVCNRDFVISDENLPDLWEIVSESREHLGNDLTLDSTLSLENLASRKNETIL